MAEPRPSAPTIVGRASELTVIREALSGSLSGRPTAVLVAGEAGVGKSRLIREARREQPFATWTILETFALPDQGAPAYFATARLVNRASRVQHVDPDLVHEVESALQGVRAGPSLAHAGSGAEGRFRLLDAMVRLVESAARERPLLITFDDMQWASEADWTVIGHLIRSAEAPLALMIAARDERLWHAASPALSTLLELNRERSLTQVSLTPLSAGHLSLLCRELTGGLPSGSVADALFERTGGNPFLTEELLGHLLRQGALSVTGESLEFTSDHAARLSMPPTVRLTTSRLLESLDGAAREVLEVAAVCGRVFTEDGLGAAGCPPAAVRLALADGQAAGLVMPAGVDWTFRHDLIREAVLATVEAARRVTLHRRLAEVLLDDNVRVSDGSRFSRLAAAVHHWQAADEPARAFDAASEASRLASHAFAPDDALRFAVVAHECALELAVPGGGGDTRLVTALEIRGDAELDAGLYIPAEARFEELLEKAIALGDERLAGTALLRMGLVWRRREDPQKAAAYLTRAISMLEPMPGEGRSIARALVELSNIEGLTLADYGSAEEFASRALAIAEHIEDRRIEVESLIALGNTRTRGAGPRAARAILEDALARAESAGELGLAVDTAAGLSNNYYWSGELRRAQYFGEKRLEMATRAHDIFGLRHGHSWLALLACSRGEWPVALDLLRDAEPMLSRLASPEPIGFIRVVSAFVHYRTGDTNRAYEEISDGMKALTPLGDGTLLWYGSLAALICLAAGRRPEALQHMQLQERRLQSLPTAALPARSARAALGLAYAEIGDRDGATGCASQLAGFEEDFHWSPVRRTLAKASALGGDLPAALGHLELAASQARAEGQRPDLGLILLDLGQLLPANDRRRPAALEDARQIFDELSMKREQALVARLLRTAYPATVPGGLSPREVEVLRLVAEGCSNREIASRLVISERTAINHVSNILSKLGLDNRTAAAAFGLRHGLVDS